MFTKFLTAAALAALVTCSSASAAPVTVQLRVEGATSTIFEGPITTDGKLIDKGDGPHPCDGTTAAPPQPAGPTMTAALDDASLAAGFSWEASWFDFGDFFITKIGPDAGTSSTYWGTVRNFEPTPVGGCWQQVRSGDELLFGYGDVYAQPLLNLAGPVGAQVGRAAGFTVTDGKTGAPVGGASVGGKITRRDGRVGLSFDTPGLKHVKAERADSVRSNAVVVCVAPVQGDDCGVPASQLGRSGGQASDSKAPMARIANPRSGLRYRRGPRLLRGTATDDGSGVEVIKLSLRRRVGGRCSQWSGRRERFVRKSCRRASFFAVGADPSWSYLLPRRLPRGRYTLDVEAFDRAGNHGQRFVRGQSRIVFEVLGGRGR